MALFGTKYRGLFIQSTFVKTLKRDYSNKKDETCIYLFIYLCIYLFSCRAEFVFYSVLCLSKAFEAKARINLTFIKGWSFFFSYLALLSCVKTEIVLKHDYIYS